MILEEPLDINRSRRIIAFIQYMVGLKIFFHTKNGVIGAKGNLFDNVRDLILEIEEYFKLTFNALPNL